MSALHQAIADWNDALFKWLLEHSADVNEPDDEGNTPLMLAIRRGIYAEQIQELLKRGADIHAMDRSERTPLMLALEHGSHDSMRVLLAHFSLLGETPQVDSAFSQGRLALLFAVYINDVVAVETLLRAGVDPNAKNEQGRTPLMFAVERDHVDIVVRLLASGADVHATETEGYGLMIHQTALHIAADNGRVECMRVLLEHGADVNARDGRHWTPLIWAANWSGRQAAVRLLIERGADIHAEDEEGNSALSQAGWLGDADTIRTLLQAGAGSHTGHLRDAFRAAFTENNDDKAPMFIAAGLTIGLTEAVIMNDMPCITRLLAQDVDQDELDGVLVAAARHATPGVVRLILEHGANPSPVGDGDQTPLIQAYWNLPHGLENIEALLQAGADVNARNDRQETPFTVRTGWRWRIPEQARIFLMRTMLKYGADVNVQNIDGTTALMDATRLGETSVARFLIKHGAQVNVRDNEGRTALMFAVAQGHMSTVRLLLKHGAAVTERANDGETALTLAKRWTGGMVATILTDAGAKE